MQFLKNQVDIKKVMNASPEMLNSG